MAEIVLEPGTRLLVLWLADDDAAMAALDIGPWMFLQALLSGETAAVALASAQGAAPR